MDFDVYSMTDAEMARIVFHGQPSARIAYRFLHARLLYTFSNSQLVGNPYEAPGVDPILEPFAEIHFLSASCGRVETAKSVALSIIDRIRAESDRANVEGRKLIEAGNAVGWNIDHDHIIDCLKLRHLLIGNLFYTDCGERLMTAMYDVMEAIDILAKVAGIPFIPAPKESIIVPMSRKGEAVVVMRAAYEAISRVHDNIEVDELTVKVSDSTFPTIV